MLRDILSSQTVNPAFLKRMSELKQNAAQVAKKMAEKTPLSAAEKANQELLEKLKEGNEQGESLIKQLKENEKSLKNNAKAMAKERLSKLKEYLKVIKNLYMHDPKRLAKEMQHVARELRDIVKQYKEGMKESAVSDIPTIPQDQSKVIDKAETPAEAKVTTANPLSPESPKEETPKPEIKITETSEAKAAKAYADTAKAEAEMEKKAEEKDLEGFVSSVKAMVAKMKAMLRGDVPKELKKEFEELDKELKELSGGKSIGNISLLDTIDI